MNNRIFLSCVTSEFEFKRNPDTGSNEARFPGFRSTLAANLRRADCEVKVQEDFRHAAELDTVEKLADYIRGCRAVVHLLGREAGSLANDTARKAFLANNELLGGKEFLADHPELKRQLGDCADLTYTQWEAFLALHYGVDLFLYADPNYQDSHRAHLDRLRLARKFPESFASDVDLLGKLIGDLRKIIPQLPELKQEIAVSRFLRHAAEDFLGREAELAFLDDVWDRRVNVLSLIAWGGVGKTSLVCRWLERRFIDREWKEDDATPALWRYFDWTFYDQGSGSLDDENANRAGSVGDFFDQALRFFGEPNPEPQNKGRQLLELVRRQHSLLVLDGLEPLQAPPNAEQPGQLLDPDLHDLLVGLAQLNPGLCLLTSRQPVRDLKGMAGRASELRNLDELPKETAIRLLRKMQITGTNEELAEACDRFDCHALSLTLLGRFLCDAHGGDIARIDRVNLHKADRLTRPERHRTTWRVLQAYDQWLSTEQSDPTLLAILRLTGLFDRPATADCLRELRGGELIARLTDAVHNLDHDEWQVLLKRLERAHLIRLRASRNEPDEWDIDAHPLVREYFAEQLRTKLPEAFRAAHSRLFDHLCATTEHRPDTLDGLQPLYQAVVHGCLAERQQEACDKVYVDRILRGTGHDGFFSTRKLGAIGADLAAVAAFFDQPWRHLSPNLIEATQAWLLHEAGFSLRTLGRLTEALEPIQTAFGFVEQIENWKSAAIRAGNLSELEVTLGRLESAVAEARRAIELADRSGDDWQMFIVTRTTAADALHQFGSVTGEVESVKAWEEASSLFAEAERMQQERQPQFDLLYSLQGFRDCDLLLAPAERAAWRVLDSRGSLREPTLDRGAIHDYLAALAEVERRATQTLAWSNQFGSLLDIALDHLTLARVRWYRLLLRADASDAQSFRDAIHSSIANPKSEISNPKSPISLALNGLRQAGDVEFIAKGLLTSAWIHALAGDGELAVCELDEALQIAARGPMPLYTVDVLMYRARLFAPRPTSLQRDEEQVAYPWPDSSPAADLAEARRIIEETHYHRRLGELEDAEAVV